MPPTRCRPLLSNRDGSVVRSGPDWLDRIINQVSAPVRWDKCMQTMADAWRDRADRAAARRYADWPGQAGAAAAIELVSLKTPDDLAAARALLAEHADSHADSHAPEWRLLVAPLAGTFRAPDGHQVAAGPGARSAIGTDLGHVEMRGGSHVVTAAFPATVIEWLVEDGDPVSAGQPLVRLQPAE